MFVSQTNTQSGDKPFIAGSDFTGLAGRLAKLVNSAGVAVLSAIAALTDIPSFVIVDDNVAGKPVTGRPLDPSQNVRITLKGTCNPADVLVLADPGTAADAGKVRTLPNVAGVYVQVGYAEEIGVDGQLLLTRPDLKLVRVKSADTLTALTFTGGGATGAEVGALRDALKVIAEAQGIML